MVLRDVRGDFYTEFAEGSECTESAVAVTLYGAVKKPRAEKTKERQKAAALSCQLSSYWAARKTAQKAQ
jgi:hypothetical protein